MRSLVFLFYTVILGRWKGGRGCPVIFQADPVSLCQNRTLICVIDPHNQRIFVLHTWIFLLQSHTLFEDCNVMIPGCFRLDFFPGCHLDNITE